MNSSTQQGLSPAFLSIFEGSASGSLAHQAGNPCLVFRGASNRWSEVVGEPHSDVFKLAALDNPLMGVSVIVLETRVGECFHYVLMDPSDPALWSTLDVWKGNRKFVAAMKLGEKSLVGECELSNDILETLEGLRRKCLNPQPEAFRILANGIVQYKVLETQVRAYLESEGKAGSTPPVVEVQVLASAAIRDRWDIDEQSVTQDASANSKSSEYGNMTAKTKAPGTLVTAKDFAKASREAAKLKPNTPVLVSYIDMNRFMDSSSVRNTFGFGHFQVHGRNVVSFRLQSGSAQVYWLADAADPRVWSTIDRMKKNKEVGFALTSGQGSVFLSIKLQPQRDIIGAIREESLRHPGGRSESAVFLANSGFVEEHATSDIPGIHLSYAHASVLSFEDAGHILEALRTQTSPNYVSHRAAHRTYAPPVGRAIH